MMDPGRFFSALYLGVVSGMTSEARVGALAPESWKSEASFFLPSAGRLDVVIIDEGSVGVTTNSRHWYAGEVGGRDIPDVVADFNSIGPFRP